MREVGSGLVLTGIGELVSGDPALPSRLADAAVVCGADGTLLWAGPGSGLPRALSSLPLDGAPHRADLGGRAVVPGFVDSHTHLVFAGQRGEEWEARMAGQPYAAGGIRTTVAATRAASDTDLAAGVERLAAEALASGTTTLEVKSGYGLDLATEPRLLRAAGRVTDDRTWLGAHVVPAEYADRPDDYVDLVCGPMLDACAPLARWADVFCERGAFDADQSRAVLLAARAAGLGLRVHGNQLGPGPGVALAVELGAASVDHCTHLSATDVDALAAVGGPGRAGSGAFAPGTGGASAWAASGPTGGTVATLLPTAEFSTRSPYPDARRLLDAGVRVALASDCNPGSSYTTSMPLVIALAVREMGMTVPEAVDAATAGGADALRRSDVGRLVPGAQADLVVLEAPSSSWLGYRPGVALVRGVVRSGVLVAGAFP